MQRNTFLFTDKMKFFYILLVAGFVSIVGGVSLSGQVNVAYAANAPGSNLQDSAKRGVELAKPAVVRIITNTKAQLSVSFPPTTQVTFPQKQGENYMLSVSGTGAFISGNGDILTADHVINPTAVSDSVEYLYEKAAPDIAEYMNQNKIGGTQNTAEKVRVQLKAKQLESTPKYEKSSSVAFLNTDYTGKTNAADFESLPTGVYAPIDEIKKESLPDQQDIAIVHVPLKDTLSIPIGDSESVQTQDKLTIIGFPGDADVGQKPDGLLTTSINTVDVSAKKDSDNGEPLLQVSGNINHGDSGGPALDKEGKIVGVVSFGSTDSNGSITSTSFLQASSGVTKMIQSLNLDTKAGQQQSLWQQSLTDYAATTPGHWGKAEQGFEQLVQKYPGFKTVSVYRDYAQTQAKTESTTSQVTPTAQATKGAQQSPTTPAPALTGLPSWQALAITIGAIVLVVVLATSMFAVSLRRKKKPAGADKAIDVRKGGAAGQNQGTVANAQAPVQTGNAPIGGSSNVPNTTQSTLTLKAWPCGHMNRSNARFCSVCGEPAP